MNSSLIVYIIQKLLGRFDFWSYIFLRLISFSISNILISSTNLLGIRRKFHFFHQMTNFFDLFLELCGFFFCLLLQRVDLIICLISILIGIISFFNNISHLFSLFMKFIFKLFVQVIKYNSLFSETINQIF